ncbi:sonic hedgehog protein-like [Macrobrachium rosenbergii]|uniref:sonic hedgehog protein-like n=1 Tax=Macrobrachium rosenbergii TaxID=79674 RepID=UPI0034D56B13
MGQGARSRASYWWGQRTPRNWRLQVYTCFLVMSVLCQSCVQCCGPGRGGGRRRSPRKLTPLVFKQHVPNVSENTLGASGLTEGPITRSDPRFHDLVPNYNSDIIFRDEEGTGADRLMTERCKEKLNTLAISVMNQWPGVRVRVIEGWEEEFDHAPHSLHYEGRAVDITTSDKDRAKYGMLARLAREAGFDWVYYESRSHIHCSVKSESSAASKLGGCFPGSGSVMTPSGPRPVSTLKEGDEVQVMKSDGTLAFSPVLMFLHRDEQASRLFLQLRTSKGKILTLTSSHLVFILPRDDATNKTPSLTDALTSGGAALAARVEEGDFLLVRQEGGDVALEEVTEVTEIKGSGVFAPLTSEGTVVVDGVVASCYAVIDSQRIAHWAFFPVRFYNNLKETILSILRKVGAITMPIQRKTDMVYSNSMQNLTNNDIMWKERGSFENNEVSLEKNVHIHWYARFLYTIASRLLPAHLVYS